MKFKDIKDKDTFLDQPDATRLEDCIIFIDHVVPDSDGERCGLVEDLNGITKKLQDIQEKMIQLRNSNKDCNVFEEAQNIRFDIERAGSMAGEIVSNICGMMEDLRVIEAKHRPLPGRNM